VFEQVRQERVVKRKALSAFSGIEKVKSEMRPIEPDFNGLGSTTRQGYDTTPTPDQTQRFEDFSS
jgi:hypothetical protein